MTETRFRTPPSASRQASPRYGPWLSAANWESGWARCALESPPSSSEAPRSGPGGQAFEAEWLVKEAATQSAIVARERWGAGTVVAKSGFASLACCTSPSEPKPGGLRACLRF